MKRQIIVEIDCEDERCGKCMDGFGECPFTETSLERDVAGVRYKSCLAAEKKLRDLVSAGEKLYGDSFGQLKEQQAAWDAALAAIKGEER